MAKKKTKKKKAAKPKIIGCVVKRKTGDCENYDERKVYGSAYAACYVVKLGHKKCEDIADKVARKVTSHVKKKKKVTANSIMTEVLRELRKHSKSAAFLYETHEDLS